MIIKTKSKKIQFLSIAILFGLCGLICTLIACEKNIVQTNMDVGTKNAKAFQVVENDQVYSNVDEMPTFVGGDEALLQYLGSKVKYTEEAKKANIEGLVVIEFIVNQDGGVNNATILKDIGGGLGYEALRIVRLMPNWIPGKENGQLVRVNYKLPVRFKLSSEDTKSCNQ